ncbi:MAG: chorismate-binding protein, partial [Bdellovibrionota bacterium]
MALTATFDNIAFDEFITNGWLVSEGPDHFIVGWGDWKETKNPVKDAASLFAPDFYLESATQWRLTSKWSIVTRDIFASHVLSKMRSEVNCDLQGFQWVEPSFEGFEKQFEAIREGRKNRGLVKAVPIVHAQAREIMSQARLLAILNKLTHLPSSLFAYGFWESDSSFEGVRLGLIGASPEILFSEENGVVSTVALAGTRAKPSVESPDLGGPESLLADRKERFEHQLVIEDIESVLSKLGRVEIGKTYVQELPTLYHLKTEISVRLDRPTDFSELVSTLHPTPALGVSPRSLGFSEMKLWDDIEKRGRYGAPFGVALPDGKNRCLVAIRGIR